MKLKTFFSSFALLPLVLFLSANQADACSCARTPQPCAAFSEASAVFVGTVLSFTKIPYEVDDGERKYQLMSKVAHFSIEQAYKGVSGKEVEVYTGQGDSDCGFGFVTGKRYVVYAYRGEDSDRLGTGICSRTSLVTKAKEDLQFLNGLSKAKPGGRIYGEVVRYSGDIQYEVAKRVSAMSGTTVIIEGHGQRFEVVTDMQGKYEITGLQSGEYEVSAQLPEQFGVIGPRAMPDDKHGTYKGSKVEVGDKGCAKADLDVRFDGSISGTVRDSENRPVTETAIGLFRFESLGDSKVNAQSTFAVTDEKGRYEFRMVQPGRYVVGININKPPDSETPYLRIIYPGVSNLAKAQVINVGEGTKMEGFHLNLPPRLKEREIRGVVMWSDGRPAANATVSLDHEDAPGWLKMFSGVKTNSRGEFSIKGLEGLKYSVHASVYEESPVFKSHNAEPVEVEVVENTDAIRLVIPVPAANKKD